MSLEQTEKIERWWAELSPEEREGLLPLEEGQPVPSEQATSLAETLCTPPAAAQNEEGFTIHVDEEVAAFLAEKRERFGGWTV